MTPQNFWPKAAFACAAGAFRPARSLFLVFFPLCPYLAVSADMRGPSGALASRSPLAQGALPANSALPEKKAEAPPADFISPHHAPLPFRCRSRSSSGLRQDAASRELAPLPGASAAQSGRPGEKGAAAGSVIELLHAKSLESLQEIIKREKKRAFLAALCERQKERGRIPSACFQLCPFSSEAERHCLSLPLKSLDIASIQSALPLKSLSAPCRNRLQGSLKALQYRRAKRQKKQWSGEDFSVME